LSLPALASERERRSLRLLYARRPKLYADLTRASLTFMARRTNVEDRMDFLYLGAVALMALAAWGLIAACDKLGAGK